MVREGDHSGGGGVTTLSSVALLQERFRQLERMKELRQEREAMRTTLSKSERYPTVAATVIPNDQWRHSTTLVSSEQMFFVPPHHGTAPHEYCQLSLSLCSDSSQTRLPDSPELVEGPQPEMAKSKWLPTKIDALDSDIDTSLRL